MKLKRFLFLALTFVPMVMFAISIITLPYLYKQKIVGGFFKSDFFILWILGAACWIHILSYNKIKFTAQTIIIASFFGFLGLQFFFNPLDENSIYCAFTFLSLVGLVCYLSTLDNLYKFYVLYAIVIGFAIQITIGYAQAVKN